MEALCVWPLTSELWSHEKHGLCCSSKTQTCILIRNRLPNSVLLWLLTGSGSVMWFYLSRIHRHLFLFMFFYSFQIWQTLKYSYILNQLTSNNQVQAQSFCCCFTCWVFFSFFLSSRLEVDCVSAGIPVLSGTWANVQCEILIAVVGGNRKKKKKKLLHFSICFVRKQSRWIISWSDCSFLSLQPASSPSVVGLARETHTH